MILTPTSERGMTTNIQFKLAFTPRYRVSKYKIMPTNRHISATISDNQSNTSLNNCLAFGSIANAMTIYTPLPLNITSPLFYAW